MKRLCLSLTLLAVANFLIAQCCIEAEINGPLCPFCAPPGWSIESGSPDTGQDGVGIGGCSPNCCVAEFFGSPLYDGGTAALFQGGDAISTSIGGLTPGIGYAIGFEWQPIAWDCPIDGWNTNPNAQMNFTIAGNSTTLSWSGSGWDTHIVCFTASSTSVDIIIEHVLAAGICLTAVDYIPCASLELIQNCGECCDLTVELDEGTMLCPDEQFEITGGYANEAGTPTITWECNPPIGLDYLDDLSAVNPNFFFPYNGDFDGETFVFTLLVEDDNCTRSDELIIEVLSSYEPTFDLMLCSTDGLGDLPLQSDNDFTGSWNGPADFDLWGGSTASFTFQIDPGQDNCLEELNFDFFINQTVVPEFSLIDEYCSTDINPVILPTISDNGIEGVWDVDEFTPSLWGVGDHSFYFEAENELCYEIYELDIVITDGFLPEFTLPDLLCSNELPFVFPTLSDNNFEGTWLSPSINEIFNDFEIFSNTFTPNSQDCIAELMVEVGIELVQVPSFDLMSNICTSSEVIVPSPISEEGFTGSWNPPIIDPSSNPGGNIDLEWTPDDLDDCIESVFYSIDIDPEILYDFDQPNLFCIGDTYVFPTTSDNGMVSGTWFYPDLNSLIGTGDYTNVFFPDIAFCANSIVFDFELVDEQIPEFALPSYLCYDSENLLLPSNSINNLAGSWNIDEIDVSVSAGQTIAVTFTPDDPNCVNVFETTIQVLEQISLEFNVEAPSDCASENGMIEITNVPANINFSIDNGVTWQTANSFTDLGSGNYTILAQYNFATECFQEFPVFVESLDNPQVDLVSQSDNTSCSNPNGSIVFNSTSTEAVEYSIDGGVTWQMDSNFENLDGGTYEIIIRFVNAPSCTSFRIVSLDQPIIPVIDNVIVSPLTSCLSANGSLYVESSFSNLEFSIDGGISWQSDPLFENLEDGQYEIIVRIIGSEDCQSSAMEVLDAVVVPMFVSSDFGDPSDCGVEDGYYNIMAVGVDLIYSIDDGETWTDQSDFDNLSAGNYEIIIASSSFIDCEIYHPFSLEAPNQPSIDMLMPINPTSCEESIGQIEILGASANLEFSIDGGNTWQDESIFDELPEGQYEIMIRDRDAPACFIIEEISLFAEAIDLDDVPFVASDPSECMLSDGSIVFEDIPSNDLMFSINGGIDFEDNPSFENLPAAIYELIVIQNGNEDCSFETTVELNAPDCPCDGYDVMLDVIDVSCNQLELGEIQIFLQADEQIVWSNGLTDSSLQDLESGWYYFTILYDDGNCEHQDSVFIDELAQIEFTFLENPADCEGVANGSLIIQNLTGGSGNYSLSLEGQSANANQEFENLASGTYELLVQDDEGCTATQIIEIEENETVDIDLLEEIEIQLGDTILLNPMIDPMSIDSFSWSPNNEILNPDELSALVAPILNSNFELTIFFGECINSSIVTILIEELIDEDIYVPNVIDFDSDNNNSFYIQGNEFTEILSMAIYDRWGNRVFFLEQPEVNNPLSGWIPDDSLETGVYVYFIEVQRENQIVPLIGTVTNLK